MPARSIVVPEVENGVAIGAIALSPDASRVAIAHGGHVTILDTSGRVLGSVDAHRDGRATLLAWTRDGRVLAGNGATLVIAELRDGAIETIDVAGSFDATRSPITALAVIGEVAITGHDDGAVRRVDLVGHRFERAVLAPHKKRVRAIVAGPEPGTALTASADATFAERHVGEKAPRRVRELGGWYPRALDGVRRRALVLRVGREQHGIATLEGTDVRSLDRAGGPSASLFAADGSLVISAGERALVVDVDRDATIATHTGPGTVGALAISGPGGDETLWIARGTKQIDVVPLRTSTTTGRADAGAVAGAGAGARASAGTGADTGRDERRRAIRPRHAGEIRSILATPHGLVTIGADGVAKRWDLARRLLGTIRIEGHAIRAAHAIAGGAALVVGTGTGHALVVDVATAEARSVTRATEWQHAGIAAPDDARWIAAVDLRGEVACLRPGAKRASWRTRIPGGQGGPAAWSEASRTLVVAGSPLVALLDEKGAIVAEIPARTTVARFALSSRGDRIAIATEDGAEIRALAAPSIVEARSSIGAPVTALAFSAGDADLWIAADRRIVRASAADGAHREEREASDRVTALLDLGTGAGAGLAIGTASGELEPIG